MGYMASIGALLVPNFDILNKPLDSHLLVRIYVPRQLPKGDHIEIPIIHILQQL